MLQYAIVWGALPTSERLATRERLGCIARPDLVFLTVQQGFILVVLVGILMINQCRFLWMMQAANQAQYHPLFADYHAPGYTSGHNPFFVPAAVPAAGEGRSAARQSDGPIMV